MLSHEKPPDLVIDSGKSLCTNRCLSVLTWSRPQFFRAWWSHIQSTSKSLLPHLLPGTLAQPFLELSLSSNRCFTFLGKFHFGGVFVPWSLSEQLLACLFPTLSLLKLHIGGYLGYYSTLTCDTCHHHVWSQKRKWSYRAGPQLERLSSTTFDRLNC